MSKSIVVWRMVTGRSSIHTEAIIALALKHRGYDTKFIVCDQIMSGCIQGKGIGVKRPVCSKCYNPGILSNYGLEYIKASQLVPKSRQRKLRELARTIPYDKIDDFRFHQVPVARFARGSMARYLRGAPLEVDDKKLRTQRHRQFREFLYSSLICLDAARVFYHRYRPWKLLTQQHLEYVGWGPAYHYLVINKGLDAIVWSGSLDNSKRTTMKYIRKGDTSAQHSIPDKVWQVYKNKSLTAQENRQLNQHHRLKSGSIPKDKLLQRLHISNDKPIWCVFSHVSWDVGFNPSQWPFDSIEDWVFVTVKEMLNIPNVTWLFKVHPGERLGTAIGVVQGLKERWPDVEKYITFISASSKVTTNELGSILDGGITLQSTVATQLPVFGVPVIAGNPNYPGKEFTYNEETQQGYINLIHDVANIKPLSNHLQTLARRYAYYVLIRRRLGFRMTKKQKGYSPLQPTKANLLLPGKDKVMDMICNKIINGGEFIL